MVVNEWLAIGVDEGQGPWCYDMGGNAPDYKIPQHIVKFIVDERQRALDRAAQMTMWLAAVQVKEAK